MPLPVLDVAAFAALTLAMAALWAPRPLVAPRAPLIWMFPAAAALVLALAGRLIDLRGLLVLIAVGLVCLTARLATGRYVRAAAYALMLLIAGGLFLHAFPGFDNPRVISGVVLGPDSAPYTKYLNLDKGVAGLFLPGAHAPERAASDEGTRHGLTFLWRFAILVAGALSLALGHGWIYASTRSIAAAILAHAGLNTVHFLLFSYPALAVAIRP